MWHDVEELDGLAIMPRLHRSPSCLGSSPTSASRADMIVLFLTFSIQGSGSLRVTDAVCVRVLHIMRIFPPIYYASTATSVRADASP